MTTNPYWDEVGAGLLEFKQIEAAYYAGNKCTIEAYMERHMQLYRARDTTVHRYAWAVPDPASLAFVVEHAGLRLVEIGAGNGYWAWLLAQCGVDVAAFDELPPDQEINHYFCQRKEPYGEFIEELAKTWHPVQRGGPEMLSQHTDRTLFLCWPPYETDMAAQCLDAYRGQRLISIGEPSGGCTGDETFFKALESQWNEVASHAIVQWPGIHDEIVVYERT